MTDSRVLFGAKAICAHLGVGKNVFYQLVGEGMPVCRGAGGWQAHADILDEYFRSRIETALVKEGSKKVVKP